MISIKSKKIYQKNKGITLLEILVVNLILAIILLVIFKFLLDIKRTSRNTQIINQLKNDMHYAMERIINGYMHDANKGREYGIIRASDINISSDGHSIELTYNDTNSPYSTMKIDGNSQQGEINIYYKDANSEWILREEEFALLSKATSIYSRLIYDPNITFSKIPNNSGGYYNNLIKIKLDLKAYFDPNSEENFHPPPLCTEIIWRN